MRIDKNIKIPAKAKKGGRKPKYPFAAMKIGDSIKAKDKKEFLNINGCAFVYGKKHSKKFTGRLDALRIWRIA